MEHFLQYFLVRLIQLENLNNKGSAVVSFVLAAPLILLLALAGMQLAWLLMLQAQISQAAQMSARTLTLFEPKAVELVASQYLKEGIYPITNYKIKISNEIISNKSLQVVSIEVPIKIWLGPEFNLRAVSYVP
jgi:hypothetical protein